MSRYRRGYGDYRYHAEQLKVVPYVWQNFIEQQPGRISGKVKQRLQGLALLAVQVVEREIDGRPDRYTYAELADMEGVCPNNWNQNYQGRWHVLVQLVHEMDGMALGNVRKNSKFRKEVAKVNFLPII